MLKFTNPHKIKPEITMAPLIDVVFLLLLFFSVTSSFIDLQGLKLDLPQTESQNTIEMNKKSVLVISVTKDGSIFFNKSPINLAELKKQLTRQLNTDPQQAILLQAERSSTTQQLVSVMEVINQSGGSNVSLQTVN
ncbi:MAG: biopolymer transporter ExbD [Deltaproteobacteria bacterium]|jgi:biopolymer transport protein ExbD|nr:biopolymer transporter ExbD [Deltaproteobacteria bacterium]